MSGLPKRLAAATPVALALALGISGLANATLSPRASARKVWPGGDHTLLFVVEGDSAVVRRSGGRAEIELSALRPDVVWFDDRPARHAGRMSVPSFIDSWTANGFRKSPPNAVIQTGRGAGGKSVAVELDHPVLDRAAGTLTFTIKADKGATLAHLRRHLGRVSIFVDDGTGVAYEPVSVSFTIMNPGGSDSISIPSAPSSQDTITWSEGPALSSGAGVEVSAGSDSGGGSALASLSITPSELSVRTVPGAEPPAVVTVHLYLAALAGTNDVSLILNSSPGDLVTATVGDSPPIVLTTTNFVRWS